MRIILVRTWLITVLFLIFSFVSIAETLQPYEAADYLSQLKLIEKDIRNDDIDMILKAIMMELETPPTNTINGYSGHTEKARKINKKLRRLNKELALKDRSMKPSTGIPTQKGSFSKLDDAYNGMVAEMTKIEYEIANINENLESYSNSLTMFYYKYQQPTQEKDEWLHIYNKKKTEMITISALLTATASSI